MKRLLLLGLVSAGLAQAKAKDKDPGVANPSKVVVVKLSTKGNDIAFDPTTLQVPYSGRIALEFRNEAAKDSEILHNVAVLKPGAVDGFVHDLQHSGYDLEAMRKHPAVIGMTSALAPGASETLEFQPKEPGFYPYVCIMAGHADMLGMKGILSIVANKK